MLDRIAQSLRTGRGRNFEDIGERILNSFLLKEGIVIVRAKEPSLREIIVNQSNLRQIIDFTRLPVKRRCDQKQLEDYPDTDLFALIIPQEEKGLWRLLAIINCKVSFHGRETETTFWGLIVRLSSYIRYVQVTADEDIYRGQPSELGLSCAEPRKARRLLEAFTDRIYIVKYYSEPEDPKLDADIETKRKELDQGIRRIVFDDPSYPRHTQYCHAVRPLDDLIDDLKRWRAEIPQ